MVDRISWKNSTLSFLAGVEKKPLLNVKFHTISKLTGQEHYWIWNASMVIILKRIKVYQIVLDVVTPGYIVDTTNVDAYNLLCHTASTTFMQVVSRRKKVRRYLGNIEERYGRCGRNCVTERRRRWKTRRKQRDGGGII